VAAAAKTSCPWSCSAQGYLRRGTSGCRARWRGVGHGASAATDAGAGHVAAAVFTALEHLTLQFTGYQTIAPSDLPPHVLARPLVARPPRQLQPLRPRAAAPLRPAMPAPHHLPLLPLHRCCRRRLWLLRRQVRPLLLAPRYLPHPVTQRHWIPCSTAALPNQHRPLHRLQRCRQRRRRPAALLHLHLLQRLSLSRRCKIPHRPPAVRIRAAASMHTRFWFVSSELFSSGEPCGVSWWHGSCAPAEQS